MHSPGSNGAHSVQAEENAVIAAHKGQDSQQHKIARVARGQERSSRRYLEGLVSGVVLGLLAEYYISNYLIVLNGNI